MLLKPIVGWDATSRRLLDVLATAPAAAYSLRKLKTGATKAIRAKRIYDGVEADIGFDGASAYDLDTAAILSLSGTTTPVLDGLTATPAVAYSLRKLRAAYAGSAVNVRRSSDNATTDIGFVNGQLDIASLSTFANASGVNLLKYSEALGNAAWTLSATTNGGAQTAPDSSSNAISIVETTANATHSIGQLTGAQGYGMATASIYVKCPVSNFRPWVILRTGLSAAAGFYYASFNVSTGVVGSVSAGATSAITSAGSGWYKIAITYLSASPVTVGSQSFRIALTNAGTDPGAIDFPYIGDVNYGAYVWGASLNYGTAYTPTTSAILGAAYITTWYDQSVNGNNAVQATAANQPPVFAGTPVLISGVAPAVFGDGSALYVDTGSLSSITTDRTLNCVYWTGSNANSLIDRTSGNGYIGLSDAGVSSGTNDAGIPGGLNFTILPAASISAGTVYSNNGNNFTVTTNTSSSTTLPTQQSGAAAQTGVYGFVIASNSITAGAVYTNNGKTFTVLYTTSSSTLVVCSGTGAPSASGTLTYVSGTPSGNLTFTSVNTAYDFTIVAASITAGTIYTNNGQTFTAIYTTSSATKLVCTGTGAPAAANSTLVYSSGPTTGDRAYTATSTTAWTLLTYVSGPTTGNIIATTWANAVSGTSHSGVQSHIATAIYSGGQLDFYRDGAWSPSLVYIPTPATQPPLRILRHSSVTTANNHSIAEVILFPSAISSADRTYLELSQGRYTGFQAVSDITVPVWYDQVAAPTVTDETAIVSALGTDGGSGYPTGWSWSAGGSTPTVSGGYQIVAMPANNNATTYLRYGSLATTPCSPGDIINIAITLQRPINTNIQGNATVTLYLNTYTSAGAQVSTASTSVVSGNNQTYTLTLQPAATSAFYQVWIYVLGTTTNTATTVKAKSLTVTRIVQPNALFGTNASGVLAPATLPRIATGGIINTCGPRSRPAVQWPSAANTYTMTTYNSFAMQGVVAPVQYRTGTETTWVTSAIGVFTLVNNAQSGLAAGASASSVWYSNNLLSTGVINNATSATLNSATALPLPLSIISASAGSAQSASTFGLGNDKNLSNRGWQGYIPESIVFGSTTGVNTPEIMQDISHYYGINI